MDVEYDRYLEKDAPTQATDFPKMHKSSEFQEKIQYSFLALPYKSINSDYVNFFKGAKQALDMMHYTKITKMHGHIITKSGSEHDPPSVAETINKSIDIANEQYTTKREFTSADTFSGRVGSGTTHYNRNPGYCGYVWNYTVEVDHIFPFPDDRKPDILCFGLAYKCTDNVSYSNETQYNDFWCSPFGFSEGINLKKYGQMDESNRYTFGDADMWAKYPRTPSSTFGTTEQTIRRGAWLASQTKFSILADWHVENGFKFRP